jgi:hypothetical protein
MSRSRLRQVLLIRQRNLELSRQGARELHLSFPDEYPDGHPPSQVLDVVADLKLAFSILDEEKRKRKANE